VAGKLGLRLVLELAYFFSTEIAVDNKEGFSFVHQRYHDNFVFLGVWKFKRIF
jgi:hypothetical protein